MNTATYPRRILKTGRPLGLLDVLAKIADNAVLGVRARLVARLGAQATPDTRETRLAREAAEVRRMADRQRHSSPAFASDLYAAADRHELIG